MKIKDIFHEDSKVWKQLPPYFRLILTHIHDMQIEVDALKAGGDSQLVKDLQAIIFTLNGEVQELKSKVTVNTAYTSKKKYITPYGDFSTYAAAAKAEPVVPGEEPVKWTVIRKRIKDETETAYYLNV